MSKRTIAFLVSAVLVAVSLIGCGSSAPSQPVEDSKAADEASSTNQSSIVLRLAEVHPDDYPTSVGDKEFARLVGEKTKGRIKVEVYTNGQLGQEKDIIEQVKLGAIDIARVSLSPVASLQPKLNVLILPYLYKSDEHMWKVLTGSIGDELLKSIESANLVGLCWYDAGSRNFYTKTEVKGVKDLTGLKLRVQQSDLMMDLVKSLGATPVPMAVGEIYSALQSGVIDGAENNFSTFVSQKHIEFAKYYVMDGHTKVPEITIMSKIASDRLSKEDQDIIKEAAKESINAQKEAWSKKELASEEAAKVAGAKITVLDEKALDEFKKAVTPLYEKYGKDFKDLINKIQEVN